MSTAVKGWRVPISAIGPVERTHRTEKVYRAYHPDTMRPVLWARSVRTARVRPLLSLSFLADEDMAKAEEWVLRCGSALVI